MRSQGELHEWIWNPETDHFVVALGELPGGIPMLACMDSPHASRFDVGEFVLRFSDIGLCL